jgi:hypothetical protein
MATDDSTATIATIRGLIDRLIDEDSHRASDCIEDVLSMLVRADRPIDEVARETPPTSSAPSHSKLPIQLQEQKAAAVEVGEGGDSVESRHLSSARSKKRKRSSISAPSKSEYEAWLERSRKLRELSIERGLISVEDWMALKSNGQDLVCIRLLYVFHNA